MKTQRIELNSKDRFILNGLDDDCFILQTLCTRKQKVDESIRDTLMDLANYSIMTVIELDKGD